MWRGTVRYGAMWCDVVRCGAAWRVVWRGTEPTAATKFGCVRKYTPLNPHQHASAFSSSLSHANPRAPPWCELRSADVLKAHLGYLPAAGSAGGHRTVPVQCYPRFKNLSSGCKSPALCADVASNVGIKAKSGLFWGSYIWGGTVAPSQARPRLGVSPGRPRPARALKAHLGYLPAAGALLVGPAQRPLGGSPPRCASGT